MSDYVSILLDLAGGIFIGAVLLYLFNAILDEYDGDGE